MQEAKTVLTSLKDIVQSYQLIKLFNLTNMTKTVSAYEARKNFGEIMNLAYYKGYEIVVEKMGKPMVKIVPIKKNASRSKEVLKKSLMEFAGIWSDKEAEEVRAAMKEFRKNFKIIRTK